MEKLCLLIDDVEQDTNCETITRIGKSNYRINIKTEQFNVGNSRLTEVLEDGKINIPKVIKFYKERFRNHHFDLIAFDWNLEDPNVDGVELIRQFRAHNLLKRTNIVLYSGELPDVVKGYFDEYKDDNKTFKKNWDKIKTLIGVPIIGFYDRTNYEEKIVEIIHNISKNIDVEHYLIRKLKENADLIFNNVHPRFQGRSFGEIADIIENNPSEGANFTSELIDQTLAYLLEINPKP